MALSYDDKHNHQIYITQIVTPYSSWEGGVQNEDLVTYELMVDYVTGMSFPSMVGNAGAFLQVNPGESAVQWSGKFVDVASWDYTSGNVFYANGSAFTMGTPDTAGLVAKSGNQTIAGIKTFSSFPITPSSAPTTDYQTANKKYVNDRDALIIPALLSGNNTFTGDNIFTGVVTMGTFGLNTLVFNPGSPTYAIDANAIVSCGVADYRMSHEAILDNPTSSLFTITEQSISLILEAGGTLELGNNAVNAIINVGNAASTSVNVKGLVITEASGGTYDIDAVGALSLNSSAGVINIGNDAIAQNINIGNGASARTITLGNAASTEIELNALSIDLNSGGALALNGIDDSNLTVTANNAGDKTLTISITNAGAGVGNLDLDADGAITIDSVGALSFDATNIINLTATGAYDITVNSTTGSVIIDGGEAVADAIHLHASNAAGGIDIDVGTGGLSIDQVGAGTGISLDAGSASNFATSAGALTLTSADSATWSTLANNLAIVGAGGLDLTATTNTLDILASAGSITINAIGATSDLTIGVGRNYQNTVAGTYSDLVTGTYLIDTDNTITIDSSLSGADAIHLHASGANGEISATSGTGGFDFDTSGLIDFTSTNAGANQFYVKAQGVIAGNAVNLETTNGGMILNAQGANGGITLTAATTFDLDSTGAMTIDSGSTLSIDSVDTSNLTMTANSASDKTLTLGASNAGTGDGNIALSSDKLNVSGNLNLAKYYGEWDFMGGIIGLDWTVTAVGTGTAPAVIAGNNGICQLAVAANNDESNLIFTNANFDNDKNSIAEFLFRSNTQITNQEIFVGLWASANDYLGVAFRTGTDPANIYLVTNNNAAGEVITDTTVDLLVDTYFKVRFEVFADDTFKVFINDTEVLAAHPAHTIRDIGAKPRVWLKGLAAQANQVDVDYVKVWQDR